jgi:hypothetical protein
MAVPTDSGAAQSKQLWLFDPMSPRSVGSAAFDEEWENPGLRIHFIQSEILDEALWLLMDSRIPLEAALELALRHIELVHASNGRTESKYRKETRKFFTLARLHGVQYLDEIEPTLVEDYLWEASRYRGVAVDVKSTTASNRQSILRLVFDHLRELGLWTGPDPLGASVKRARGEASRPTTAEELHRIRMFAENGLFVTGRSVLLALAEAGATAEEIATVMPVDVDLTSGHVLLRGRAERNNPLTEWGLDRLVAYYERAVPDGKKPLCVGPALPIDRAAHSVTVRLRRLLVDAGLSRLPGLTARSIRLGVARAILDSSNLESAARFLGDSSLDATAASLRYEWWER